jgi:hypothetical protein
MPNRPIEANQKTKHADWFNAAIRFWGLTVLTLHLAAPWLSEETAWSVWPWLFLPPWLGWLLALLAGALIIPPVNTALYRFLRRLILGATQKWGNKRRWFLIASVLAGVLFWLARLRHLRWGDSYMLSVALSYPDLDLRVIYNWQAPLTVFLHQRLWQFAAAPLLGWPVETVYAAISIMCGLVFVYVLLNFMAQLGRTRLEAAILTGFIVSAASMQLFFGYVENYTIISLGLLATMYLAWRALQGQIQPVWPVAGLAVTNAFHPSTVFLWPGMWLLMWLYWRQGRITTGRAVFQLGLPPLLVGLGVLALMESGGHGLDAFLGVDRPGGGDGLWFVPLFETSTQWQHYTMFSTAHLLDWVNIHFLLAPFGLPLLLFISIGIYKFKPTLFQQPADRDFALYLSVTAAMYVLLTWLWNPDYGGRKDWDLFAPSAFVYTLLAGYLFVRILTDRKQLRAGGLFVIAVSLLHTAAWIFTNTHALPRE